MQKLKIIKNSSNQEKIWMQLKKFILTGAISLSILTTLTGCNSDKIENTNIEITWENDAVTSGRVPYDDIYGNIKVVILEQNGTIKPYLMLKELKANMWNGTDLSYIDLKHGTTLVQYHWETITKPDIENDKSISITIGKYITILEEQEFYDYIFGLGEIRTKFDINEIIEIYDDEIEPQLIEYINEEYKEHTK